MARVVRNPRRLRTSDLTELTGLSRDSIGDLCRTGVIKARKSRGRGWYEVDEADAQAFARLLDQLRRENSVEAKA